ncbi:MAG: tetratricopeptide repeat protein [Alphaproteobacteria bacterium]|nr:tetratricopeptide repeat protein [Alphaproteobacteria bacterium]
MQTNKITFPPDIPIKTLTTINGLKFTAREIDIIACLISGRSSKAIGTFLAIEEKTVETHKYNIMRKLECNSRESIRDFIEKSGKFSEIKNHYVNLLVEVTFKQRLQEILALRAKGTPLNVLMYEPENGHKLPFHHKLEQSFKLVGVKLIFETRETCKSIGQLISKLESKIVNCVIYPLSETSINQRQTRDSKAKLEMAQLTQRAKQNPGAVIFLLEDQDTSIGIPQDISDIDYIDCGEVANHYFIVLEILKRVLSDLNLDKLIAEFKRQYQIIAGSFENLPSQMWSDVTDVSEKESLYNLTKLWQKRKTWLLISAIGGFCALCALFLTLSSNKVPPPSPPNKAQNHKSPVHLSVRSDLPLPADKALFKRPELMTQIEEKLKRQEGIQTLAIVGIGGAGKTTLARQYAHSQKASIVWEINAETKESLISSFENLAYALSKTEEDKKILRELQDIKEPIERINKIVLLLKEKLNSQPNWFLIYDNVERFSDIQRYFPSDPKVWGRGKVIVTTRDLNIQNNNHINNAIQIGELTPKQKLDMFIMIMGNNNDSQFNLFQRKQANYFLKDIPPFPLDVSVAAYYIKATNITYEKYLENLRQYNKEFESTQENILREASDYTKTRYSIITLSLKQLKDTHKDFGDLLLFISLLDSQNIPRDLLSTYKSDEIIDNFIYNLKKYSLIMNEFFASFQSTSDISIHRSTQEILLNYLIKTLNLNYNYSLQQRISNTLIKAISTANKGEDISIIKCLVPHIETFLTHVNLLTNNITNNIKVELGGMYLHLSYNMKAKHLLTECLTNLKKDYNKNLSGISLTLLYLGNVYRDLGYYEKARDCLEESLLIYNKFFPNQLRAKAEVLRGLGNVYRNLENYNKAKTLLEESLVIYKRYFPNNHLDLACTYSYLGNINRKLKQYNIARDLLSRGLIIHENYLPENHLGRSRILKYLGIVYFEVGNYDQAKNFLEQALKKCFEYLPLDHLETARELIYLGKIYDTLGNYENARDLFDRSLQIFQKRYPENQRGIARTSAYLGGIYTQLGQYNKAKSYLDKSFSICTKYYPHNQLAKARTLNYLGSLHYKLHEYDKARHVFLEALTIYQKHFPESHMKISRMLRNIGKTYLKTKQFEEAMDYLYRALKICQQNNSPESYICFETLASLYQEKALAEKNNKPYSQSPTEKSFHYLERALKIVKAHFAKDSPHLFRIQAKIALWRK